MADELEVSFERERAALREEQARTGRRAAPAAHKRAPATSAQDAGSAPSAAAPAPSQRQRGPKPAHKGEQAKGVTVPVPTVQPGSRNQGAKTFATIAYLWVGLMIILSQGLLGRAKALVQGTVTAAPTSAEAATPVDYRAVAQGAASTGSAQLDQLVRAYASGHPPAQINGENPITALIRAIGATVTKGGSTLGTSVPRGFRAHG